MYAVAQMQIKEGIESTNSERSLNQIHALVEQIKQLESNISRMSADIIVNQERMQSGVITDEEVEQLRAEVQQKVTQYKLLLNDKSALYEEMYCSALTMINRDKQIIKNEEEIVQLKHEIDINILEIEQKTAIIAELQEVLKEKKALYKTLKREIRELEE